MPLFRLITTGVFFVAFCVLALAVNRVSADVQVRDYNGVAYVTGGVGADQQEDIDRLAHNFSLKLTSATQDGHYLSGGNVTVKDAAGKTVLEVAGMGPILYADLNPGTYTLFVEVASFSDQIIERAVVIGARQVVESFVWPGE